VVPRVAKRGRSFKGAGLYYLHDKKAQTRNRVVFTMTVNLPTQDPDRAFRMMAYTAMRQEDIKRAAGTQSRGRKLAQSVYSYSLSWAPDENPTKEEMIEAAFASMEDLGIEEHEAVLIAHNDTPHPHIHVIVNRVNPHTGLAAPLSKDHIVLSEWAEGYERAQGLIRIEQRVENNKERQKGRFVKDKDSEDAAAYRRWQKAREREADRLRRQQEQQTSEQQKREREELERKGRDEIETIRKTQKEVQKADWADLYKRQKKERDAFEKAQQSPFGRLRYWLANKEIDRFSGDLEERGNKIQRAFQILSDGNIMRDAVKAREVRERAELTTKLKLLTEAKVAPVAEQHRLARQQLDERHAADAQQQKLDHKQSREREKTIAREGFDRTAFDFEQSAKNTGRKQEPKREPKQDQTEEEFSRFSDRSRAPARSQTPADDEGGKTPDDKTPSRTTPEPEEEFNVFSRRGRSQEITSEPGKDEAPEREESPFDAFSRAGRGGPKRGGPGQEE